MAPPSKNKSEAAAVPRFGRVGNNLKMGIVGALLPLVGVVVCKAAIHARTSTEDTLARTNLWLVGICAP